MSTRHKLEAFDQRLSRPDRKILKETNDSDPYNLTPRLRDLFLDRRRLKEDANFWENADRLRKGILSLPEYGPMTAKKEESRRLESEQIAEAAIRTFEENKTKFRMLRPAVLQNILINLGLKKEGFCWHWTRAFQNQLAQLPLQEYELLWATAYQGKIREHNTLVIVSKGGRLEEGLLLDGWRHAGKPFWTRVATDHYPWRLGRYRGE